jgi:hypothetical protein
LSLFYISEIALIKKLIIQNKRVGALTHNLKKGSPEIMVLRRSNEWAAWRNVYCDSKKYLIATIGKKGWMQ